ncbi:MAG TPA: hypothetical protein PKV35_02345, partial [bacterium]|nr:hypothetical protein [bacterium]
PICPTDDFQEPNCTMLSNHGVDLFYDDNNEILKWTLTNLLISNLDAPFSNFDIPDQPELVACTPANIPLDPDNPDSFWCPSGEHTFAIRIQNWGNSDAEKIVVKAEIPKGMEYVAGSTEYSDEFCIYQNKKHAEIFNTISDNENGFPLADGFNITELTGKLNPCPEDSDYLSCENTIIIRYKAKIKDSTPKHFVIESSANIETYNSNQGIPLKLRYSGSSDCGMDYYSDESDCGGYPEACNPCGNNDAESGNSNDSENIDTETIPDSDDKALINDSDTETDEKDNSSGCGCSILGDQ